MAENLNNNCEEGTVIYLHNSIIRFLDRQREHEIFVLSGKKYFNIILNTILMQSQISVQYRLTVSLCYSLMFLVSFRSSSTCL
jgi:hypothetical protein